LQLILTQIKKSKEGKKEKDRKRKKERDAKNRLAFESLLFPFIKSKRSVSKHRLINETLPKLDCKRVAQLIIYLCIAISVYFFKKYVNYFKIKIALTYDECIMSKDKVVTLMQLILLIS